MNAIPRLPKSPLSKFLNAQKRADEKIGTGGGIKQSTNVTRRISRRTGSRKLI